jgi:hypothetical protein
MAGSDRRYERMIRPEIGQCEHMFEYLAMRVMIEPPDGWEPARVLLIQLRRLGYDIEEHIVLGKRLFVVSARPSVPTSPECGC